eukprot:SAG22_NODE_1223_length_5120_cov_7.942442_2_plen_369_part_00
MASKNAWSTELPCVAQMFEACAATWAKKTGAGPPVNMVPMCYRGRKKGANGEALKIAGELAAEAARIVASGAETSAREQELLEQAYFLGWDEVSWAEAGKHVRNLAAWLRTNGVKRGDRVCMFADGGGDFNLLFWALQYVGAAAVVREPRMDIQEAVMIANATEPVMIVMGTTDAGGMEDCMKNPAGLRGVSENFPWVAANGPSVPVFALELDKLSAAGAAALQADDSLGACAGQPEDIAVLCTTSGTTGVPKAAMHSQRALYHLGRFGEELLRSTPEFNLGGGGWGLSGERYMLPFDAGYISYIMLITLGVAGGLEGTYMERPELRLRFGELQPAFMMMLADQCTERCHGAKAKMAAKPLGALPSTL